MQGIHFRLEIVFANSLRQDLPAFWTKVCNVVPFLLSLAKDASAPSSPKSYNYESKVETVWILCAKHLEVHIEINLKTGWTGRNFLLSNSRISHIQSYIQGVFVSLLSCTGSTACLNKFRIRVIGVQGNQVHSITPEGLRIPNPDFQPILSRAKFYSIAT